MSVGVSPYGTVPRAWRLWCTECSEDLRRFAEMPGNRCLQPLFVGDDGYDEYLRRVGERLTREGEFMREAVARRGLSES
jgi:hypothetical protein